MAIRALKLFYVIVGLSAGPASAADILDSYRCELPDFSGPVFFTAEFNGSPARVGVRPVVGNEAIVYRDPSEGMEVWVELNGIGMPITMTTFNAQHQVSHSRHIYAVGGETFPPSQVRGQCEVLK